MAWARENRYVVFTHDLDFGTLLAVTRESGDSSTVTIAPWCSCGSYVRIAVMTSCSRCAGRTSWVRT
jgi:hypothetical protein